MKRCGRIAGARRRLRIALLWSAACVSSGTATAGDDVLPPLSATAGRADGGAAGWTLDRRRGLDNTQAGTSDTAQLLSTLPGVSLYGAGGLSALPALRGLADDRLRIRVNGVDLQSACPNHMNAPLSYVAPSAVSAVTVHAGVTPVSAGGDSLGGSIDVSAAPPVFAAPGQPAVVQGEVGVFHRSNGDVQGGHAQAAYGNEAWSLSYNGATAKARNVHAARAFKAAESGTEGGGPLPGDELGSTAYHFVNHELALAWRFEAHLLRLSLGEQRVFFEGFPNQRMDMTDNHNDVVNLRYQGIFDWGELAARLSTQRTRHAMDMGPDRYQYGTGMPMLTKADTDSGQLGVTVPVGAQDTFKAGGEYVHYTLYDWWPPVGGSMGPQALWNVDNGRRDRTGVYGEWLRQWDAPWTTQLGWRREQVVADASPVQGYNNALAALWGSEAAAFNARDHHHRDQNWDLTALVRHQSDASRTLELGYARKTRSPNLYQRYPWSTQPMAALMNNFVGDGNGYIGQEDLRPEVAHTLNLSGQWRSPVADDWQVGANAYVTRIDDYIDAQRCHVGQCSVANQSATTGFVLLQYVNQTARIAGMDLSGGALLTRSEAWGQWDVQGVLNVLRGDNLSTGEPLYNMMPANASLSLVQRVGPWTQTAEWQSVAGKHRVSAVRNEVQTGGYSLLNLRSRREWGHARLELGVDNVFNRFYRQPLGGAYVGQGASMTSNGVPWGQVMPGMGRSLNLALTWRY